MDEDLPGLLYKPSRQTYELRLSRSAPPAQYQAPLSPLFEAGRPIAGINQMQPYRRLPSSSRCIAGLPFSQPRS